LLVEENLFGRRDKVQITIDENQLSLFKGGDELETD